LAPQVHVSTEALFSDPQLTRDAPPIKIRDYLRWVGSGGTFGSSGTSVNISGAFFDGADFVGKADQLCNVFEPLVRAKHQEIDAALTWLTQFAPARLTGTGACVFAAFADESQAREVANQVDGRWQTIVAAACNRSPLFTKSLK